MATIIDSLIVTLGLDNSNFTKGANKVNQTLGDTKKKANDADKSFKELTSSAAKFLAVIGGAAAIKGFITDAMESSAAIYRLSQNLGLAVESVSAWSNATAIAGGSAEGLQSTLSMLSKAQTELQLTGQSGLVPYFSALGVSLQNLTPPEQLLQLADRFSQMDRTKANNMGQMMGIDQGTLNAMLEGRKALELTLKRQTENTVITKKQGEEAVRFQKALRESKLEITAFGRELLSQATPALERLLSIFSNIGSWLRQNKEVVAGALEAVGAALVVIGASLVPINLTAAAIIGLGAAFGILQQDYLVWKRNGDSAFNWQGWINNINLFKQEIKELGDFAGKIFYKLFAGVDAVKSILTGDIGHAKWAVGEMINGVPAGANTPKDAQSGNSAMEYFKSKGWTSQQAAGLAANIQRESNGKANAVGDGGKAYGIGQWHPDRQAEFKKFMGKDIKGSSYEEQLAFMNYELTSGKEKSAGDKLRKATTARQSAEIVSKYYERPADKEGEARKRGDIADNLINGIPKASQLAASAPIRGTKASNLPTSNNTSTTQTNIGEIKVYTQATDANGMVNDMNTAMNNLLVSQANFGEF